MNIKNLPDGVYTDVSLKRDEAYAGIVLIRNGKNVREGRLEINEKIDPDWAEAEAIDIARSMFPDETIYNDNYHACLSNNAVLVNRKKNPAHHVSRGNSERQIKTFKKKKYKKNFREPKVKTQNVGSLLRMTRYLKEDDAISLKDGKAKFISKSLSTRGIFSASYIRVWLRRETEEDSTVRCSNK